MLKKNSSLASFLLLPSWARSVQSSPKTATTNQFWEQTNFHSSPPETAADEAARNYVYDQEQLDLIGTEGGVWEFRFDDQGSGSNEAVADKRAINHGNG